MSPLGNILFLPFLSAFLFMATLIFFFELCTLPNEWLIYALEKILACWLYCMQFSSKSWLISFAKPSLAFLVCVPLVALTILFTKKITRHFTLFAFLGALLFFCGCMKYPFFAATEKTISVPCNKGHVTIVYKNAQISVIDSGYLGQTIASPTWLEFTLIPLLNQHFGSQTITNLIVLQPSIMTFACVEKLCQLCIVKNCCIPLWQGNTDKALLRSYGYMKRALEKNHTHLTRIKNVPLVLDAITITPQKQTISYKNSMFKIMRVDISLQEQNLEIYSAKKQK